MVCYLQSPFSKMSFSGHLEKNTLVTFLSKYKQLDIDIIRCNQLCVCKLLSEQTLNLKQSTPGLKENSLLKVESKYIPNSLRSPWVNFVNSLNVFKNDWTILWSLKYALFCHYHNKFKFKVRKYISGQKVMLKIHTLTVSNLTFLFK